jgi:hypothetical protein
MSTASLDPTALRRARLSLALASLPPLHCADCGKQVSLPFATSAVRAGVCVDLCPSCAARGRP